MGERKKIREKSQKKTIKRIVKSFNNTKIFYEYLKDLTVNRRVDSIKNSLKSKYRKHVCSYVTHNIN